MKTTAGRKPLPPGQKKTPVTIYVEKSKIDFVGKNMLVFALENTANDMIKKYIDIYTMYKSGKTIDEISSIHQYYQNAGIIIESMKERGIIE